MSTAWTGQLHPKRKQELLDIAEALGLETDDADLKTELEEKIESVLHNSTEFRDDPKFIGLWQAMGRRKLTRPLRTSSVDDDSVSVSTTPAGASSAASPLRLGNHSLSPLAARRSLSTAVARTTAVPAKGITKLKVATTQAISGAQTSMNGAWAVTAALVGAELVYVSWSAVPWQEKTYGPHHWYTRNPTPSFHLALPKISVLAHPTFLLPLLSWTALSVLLPLVLAVVLAFPQKRSRLPAPPDAVVFNITRLALAVLLHYIFASAPDPLKWSFAHVQGYPAVQVLGSTVGTLLTTYEELSR